MCANPVGCSVVAPAAVDQCHRSSVDENDMFFIVSYDTISLSVVVPHSSFLTPLCRTLTEKGPADIAVLVHAQTVMLSLSRTLCEF